MRFLLATLVSLLILTAATLVGCGSDGEPPYTETATVSVNRLASTATNEVCIPDPVLCPVPQSAQATETIEFPLSGETVALAGDFIWGTGIVTLIDTDQNEIATFTDWEDLNGHNWMERRPALPLFNGKTFRDRFGGLRNVCNANTRDNRCIVRMTYGYAVSDEREFVLTPDSLFHALRWARFHPNRGTVPDSVLNAQPIVAHLVNLIRRYRATAGAEYRSVQPTIILPRGSFEWHGSISLGFPINIRGAGGAEVVDVQTTVEVDGEEIVLDYRPVRQVEGPKKTRLKRPAGAAGDYLRYQLNEDDPYYAEKPHSLALGTGRMAMFYIHSSGSGTHISDLICDGNLYERVTTPDGQPVEGPDGASSLEIQQHISANYPGESDHRGPILDTARNSPSEACFTAQNHGGVEVRDGTVIFLTGVDATGVASSYLGKIGSTFWVIRQSRGGDNTVNHVNYCVDGDHEDFTFTGFSWDHNVVCPVDESDFIGPDGEPRRVRNVNITFERLRANPVRYNKGLVEVRRADYEIEDSFVDLRTPDEGTVLNTFIYQEPHGVRVSNTTIVSKSISSGGYRFGIPGLVRDARDHVVYDGVTAYLDEINTFVGQGRGPVYIRNSSLNVLDSSERVREFGHRGSGRLYLLDNVSTNARFQFFTGNRDYSAAETNPVCIRGPRPQTRRSFTEPSSSQCDRYFADAEAQLLD